MGVLLVVGAGRRLSVRRGVVCAGNRRISFLMLAEVEGGEGREGEIACS